MPNSEAETDAVYARLLQEHARQPLHRGRPATVAAEGHGTNPMCGDEITVFLTERAPDSFGEIWFQAQACALCQASASLMIRQTSPLDPAAALVLANEMAHLERMTPPDQSVDDAWRCIQHVLKTAPRRRRCVELPWIALENALRIPPNLD